jgi:hypothetical protein
MVIPINKNQNERVPRENKPGTNQENKPGTNQENKPGTNHQEQNVNKLGTLSPGHHESDRAVSGLT